MDAPQQQQQLAANLQGQALQEQEQALSLLRRLESKLLNGDDDEDKAKGSSESNGGAEGDGASAKRRREQVETTIRTVISTQESAGRLLVQASQAQLAAITALALQASKPAAAPPPMQAQAPPLALPPQPQPPQYPAYAAPPPPGLPMAPSDPYSQLPPAQSYYAPVPGADGQMYYGYDYAAAAGISAELPPGAKRQAVGGEGGLKPQVLEKPERYKTVQCRNFTETGVCKFGDRCNYAHGSEEQRYNH